MPDQAVPRQDSFQAVIQELHTARSLADTLQTVADGIVHGLGYELACVNLVRPDGDLVVAAFSGDDGADSLLTGRVGPRASWDRRLAMGEAWGALRFIPHSEGWILDHDDVPQWHTERPIPRHEGEWHPSDRLFAPMYLSGESSPELLGVLSVGGPRSGLRPGPEQREALQSYAFQAAIAISNARLRANMQRALVRLEREQAALRASEESFRQAFEYAPAGMAIAEMGGEEHGRLLRTNDVLCRMLDRPASVLRRYTFADLVHPEDIGTLLRTSAEGGRVELRLGRRDGTYVWVSLRHSVVADTPDGPRFVLTNVEDIQDRKLREFELAHRASHDSLTDLPNSSELDVRLNARLCTSPDRPASAHDGHQHEVEPGDYPDARGLAVMFCALRGFKAINVRFGRHSGDTVLIEVSRRLAGIARSGDVVARLGGDEFVVLADRLTHAEARNLAARMHDEIRDPICINGEAVCVGVSIGIMWAHCGSTAAETIRAVREAVA
ncbi:diguanylate cyclase CdgB [Streptomyces goshikiensis]|uniref:diguanylate cyclase CdgB n=1 Tax=Streptomyces goshikiensis TaxID=1942 RepID=UPI0036561A9F